MIRAALGAGDWELEWIEREGGTRSALDTPLWSALDEFVATIEPGARLLPICNAGFHRQPLPARGVRDDRVRVLPDARDGHRACLSARALGRRAGARWTISSSVSRRSGMPRTRFSDGVLELRTPAGAFEQIEAWLRGHGFFAPGWRGSRRRSLPRLRALRGRSAAGRRRLHPSRVLRCRWPRVPSGRRRGRPPRRRGRSDRRAGSARGRRPRTRAPSNAVRAAIERGDVYQVNLVQHVSAPFAGDPRALAARLAPLVGDARRRSTGDGWAIVSASPELFLARRGRRVWTMPIKGTLPLDSPDDLARLGEGRGRARDDRRPRAERSLSRLRAGQRSLARADGRAARWPVCATSSRPWRARCATASGWRSC